MKPFVKVFLWIFFGFWIFNSILVFLWLFYGSVVGFWFLAISFTFAMVSIVTYFCCFQTWSNQNIQPTPLRNQHREMSESSSRTRSGFFRNESSENDVLNGRPTRTHSGRNPNGLRRHELDELCPIIIYNYSLSKSNDESCAICLEGLDVSCSIRILPCSHFYHSACIARWLNRKRHCPLCNCEMVPKEYAKNESDNTDLVSDWHSQNRIESEIHPEVV